MFPLNNPASHRSIVVAGGRSSMKRSPLIVLTAALLMGATSFASAKNRAAAHAHSKPAPQILNDTTPRATTPDPYYRLSDAYYGDSDPYRGLFNFYALPPYSPGSAYGHIRPMGGH
jgi:hypothetical protein